MTALREAAQQALEALEQRLPLKGQAAIIDELNNLRAALAQQDEPVEEQDVEDAIEAAYWHFDARKKGLNEWASAPQSERDAFKAEARKLVRGYFPTRQAQDTKREMLAVADAFIRGKRSAQEQAEPVAWLQPKTVDGYSRPDLGYETCSKDDYGAFPVYRALAQEQAKPVEPVDVGLLEYRGNSVAFIHQKMTAYRTGIDAAWDAFRANGLHPDGKTPLADMIAKHTAPPQRQPQTIDEALTPPRAMAQAYENGYKAGVAHEREECAKLCEARFMGDLTREDMEARRCAAAIRARGVQS